MKSFFIGLLLLLFVAILYGDGEARSINWVEDRNYQVKQRLNKIGMGHKLHAVIQYWGKQ
jgi:hypothetical protein